MLQNLLIVFKLSTDKIRELRLQNRFEIALVDNLPDKLTRL